MHEELVSGTTFPRLFTFVAMRTAKKLREQHAIDKVEDLEWHEVGKGNKASIMITVPRSQEMTKLERGRLRRFDHHSNFWREIEKYREKITAETFSERPTLFLSSFGHQSTY